VFRSWGFLCFSLHERALSPRDLYSYLYLLPHLLGVPALINSPFPFLTADFDYSDWFREDEYLGPFSFFVIVAVCRFVRVVVFSLPVPPPHPRKRTDPPYLLLLQLACPGPNFLLFFPHFTF